jgi:hypothetical protein
VQFGRTTLLNHEPAPVACPERSRGVKKEKPTRPERRRREKQKNDPRLIAAARELRDRWMERVNEDPALLLGNGKYQVSKELSDPTNPPVPLFPSLAA